MFSTTMIGRTPTKRTGPYNASWPLAIKQAAKMTATRIPRSSQSDVPRSTWEGWMRDEALVRQIRNKQGGRTFMTMDDPMEVLKRTLGG